MSDSCNQCAALDVAFKAVLEKAAEWKRKAELWDLISRRAPDLPDLMFRYRPAGPLNNGEPTWSQEIKIGFGELDTFGSDAAETLLHCLKRDPS